jgi:hypothetical protein
VRVFVEDARRLYRQFVTAVWIDQPLAGGAAPTNADPAPADGGCDEALAAPETHRPAP